MGVQGRQSSGSGRRLLPLLSLLPILPLLLPNPAAAAEPSDPEPAARGPDWMLVVTPMGGVLRNTARFEVPTGSADEDGDGETELTYDTYEYTDTGWGGGATLMGFYKYVSLTSVFFGFPEVNQSHVLGNITYLGGMIPTGSFVEPYLGMGLALVATDIRFFDFQDTKYDEYAGMTMRGDASMPFIHVRNDVVAPFPKVGVKFALPIQHWYVQPFYSLMYEQVHTRARSGGGEVQLREVDPETHELVDGGLETFIEVRAFDSDRTKEYVSHLVGMDFLVDFHYFLQLRGKVYYNTNHDLWTLRLIGSIMLSAHMGIAAYFEYTEKITVTNTYFLLGPAIMFSPEGFMEEMMARRHRKGGER
jgi:hypothetical protein